MNEHKGVYQIDLYAIVNQKIRRLTNNYLSTSCLIINTDQEAPKHDLIISSYFDEAEWNITKEYVARKKHNNIIIYKVVYNYNIY